MYEFLEYRVCDVMTENPIALGRGASLADAVRIFDEHDFNAIPIAEGGKLLGVISKLDVLAAFRFTADQTLPAYDEIMKRSVVDVMTREPSTVAPRERLTDVLAKLVDSGVKSFPVLSGDELVGIVAREDVLRGLRRASAGEVASGPI